MEREKLRSRLRLLMKLHKLRKTPSIRDINLYDRELFHIDSRPVSKLSLLSAMMKIIHTTLYCIYTYFFSNE